ncbi:MAG: AsmA family protein, partial [Pseudomonadota bacterium]|nr:AsmA family protein [Pseudomonadota bacterium]
MKIIKWAVLGIGVLLALCIAAAIIVPQVVDVQKFKPQIEKMASETTGRTVTLGGEIKLSLFPWVGVSLADLHLGNPSEFKENDLLTVKSFEFRVKLLPLLAKDIQVKKLLLDGARVSLEKLKDGRGNWEGIGKSDNKAVVQSEKKTPTQTSAGLPIKSLAVGEFAITNSLLRFEDHKTAVKKEISAINLRLRDVSLDKPVHLSFSAAVDGHPVSMKGMVGPLGKEPGRGTIPLDMVVKAMNELDLTVKGNVVDPLSKQKFDLVLNLSPFSPRKLASAFGQDFPLETADPKSLSRFGMHARVAGSPMDIAISDGTMELDNSNLVFSARINEFSRPNIQFDLNLDQIDIDRYLPPPAEKIATPAADKKKVPAVKTTGEKKKPASTAAAGKKKIDYAPLRRLILDGKLKAGKLKVHGLQVQDVVVKIKGKEGKFQLNPLALNLYRGTFSAAGMFNCRPKHPRSSFDLQLKNVKVGSLLKDFLQKDILAGTLVSKLSLSMTGDEPETIKRSLNGKGNISLKDGAIIGIDLASMVRNVKIGLGLAEKTVEKPRTDFAELLVPFTIVNGLVDTPGTTLKSPLLRLSVVGKADLVQELLDFRIKPKVVGTIKGQGDTRERSGLMVPLVVSGTFSSPKIRPDLQGMIGNGVPETEELKKMISGDGTAEEK